MNELKWWQVLPRFLWYKLKETWWLFAIPLIEIFPIRLWMVPYFVTQCNPEVSEEFRIMVSWFIANLFALFGIIILGLIGVLIYELINELIKWLGKNWRKAARDELSARGRK